MPSARRSPDQLELDGELLYRKHKFKEALQLYNQAISADIWNIKDSLLNRRLVCLAHLGPQEQEVAISEARDWAKERPQECLAYLCLGRLLTSSGQPHRALKIYERGLRQVPKTSELYRTLEEKYIVLTKTANLVDPLAVLPNELKEMVLGFLDFRQMVRCLLVSKNWRDVIVGTPSLWKVIDLTKLRRSKVVKSSFIQSCVNRSLSSITTVSLPYTVPLKIAQPIFTNCWDLKKLELLAYDSRTDKFLQSMGLGRNLRHLKFDIGSIDMTTVEHILRTNPNLQEVMLKTISLSKRTARWLSPMPKLEKLSLHFGGFDDTATGSLEIQTLYRLAPNIKELKIGSFNGFWHSPRPDDASREPVFNNIPPILLRVLDTTSSDAAAIGNGPLGYHYVRTEYLETVRLNDNYVYGQRPCWLARVQDLEFRGLPAISSQLLSELLEGTDLTRDSAYTAGYVTKNLVLPSLRRFAMDAQSLSDSDIVGMLPWYPRLVDLEDLRLEGRTVVDATAITISSKCHISTSLEFMLIS